MPGHKDNDPMIKLAQRIDYRPETNSKAINYFKDNLSTDPNFLTANKWKECNVKEKVDPAGYTRKKIFFRYKIYKKSHLITRAQTAINTGP